MHITIGSFTIATRPGLTVRTLWHEVFVGHVPGPARLDCWRSQNSLFIRLGHGELVASRLPPCVDTETEATANA